jgi:hypothetical protein
MGIRRYWILLVAILLGCVPRLEVENYDLIVDNQCRGANRPVHIYINSQYRGLVQDTKRFIVPAGSALDLRAVGTKAGALTFLRKVRMDGDKLWTLCP